jgi:ribose transport system ATP-binding protein
MTQDSIVAAMVGRELLSAESVPPGDRSRCVLSVSNLTLSKPHRSGWRTALQGVSFKLHAGEILGIAGLLGSGRTEILEVLFGSARGQVSGEIELFGEPVEIASPREARRLGIALVTEDRKAQGLHLDSSITENVTLPLVGQLAKLGVRSFRRENEISRRSVRSLGIRCNTIDQAAKTLSGGNQQKVVIAKWLATQPRILLLDEPTRGIDVGAKREIYDLIFRLSRQEGFAILVVSSELPELLHLADNILVMAAGRQRGLLARADATEEKIMRLAAPSGARQAAA